MRILNDSISNKPKRLHYWLGGSCRSKRLPYRLVAGVWTLAAFVFVQAYTSTLFTYVVTPINHPLIDSVYDVIDNGDINLLVRESGSMNTLLSASKKKKNSNELYDIRNLLNCNVQQTNNFTGLFGNLRKKINSFPNSRCATASDCIRPIKPESKIVLLEVEYSQFAVFLTRFKELLIFLNWLIKLGQCLPQRCDQEWF
jgi:hypothetical protein